MKRVRSNLTYANVISTLALFLVLAGGTAFAAGQLAKNSVGTKQIKNAAVTPAKLSKAAKSRLTGPAGPAGPTGSQGKDGSPGKEGPPGSVGAGSTLTSGQTETGVFAAGGAQEGEVGTAISFVPALAAPLDEHHVVYLEENEASAPHCPGVGQAEAGYLCVYSKEEENVGPAEILDAVVGDEGAGKDGAAVFAEAGTSDHNAYIWGTWAVTAP